MTTIDGGSRMVYVWDAQTGRITRRIFVTEAVVRLEFSPSNKTLLIQTRTAVAVDLTTGREQHWPPSGERNDDAWSQAPPRLLDNDRIVVYFDNGPQRIRGWDRNTGKLVFDWSVVNGKIGYPITAVTPHIPLFA
jgi:hypothetical protein